MFIYSTVCVGHPDQRRDENRDKVCCKNDVKTTTVLQAVIYKLTISKIMILQTLTIFHQFLCVVYRFPVFPHAAPYKSPALNPP